MKPYDWSDEKNEWLRQERGITFEDIVFHLAHGGLLDTIEHPNQRQYPGQRSSSSMWKATPVSCHSWRMTR